MDEGGFQCAFCAPGFTMSMVGMLAKNPNPTREEAAHLLSGNLCRCGDYDKILNTAMRAAELSRSGSPWTKSPRHSSGDASALAASPRPFTL